MEGPPPQSLKLIANSSEHPGQLFNRLLCLLFADPKHGILKFYLGLGGFTMIRYLNPLLRGSFCRLALLWYGAKEISSSPTEWKWESHFCLKSTINQQKDTWMIGKSINNNKNRKKKINLNYLHKELKRLNNLQLLVCNQYKNKR